MLEILSENSRKLTGGVSASQAGLHVLQHFSEMERKAKTLTVIPGDVRKRHIHGFIVIVCETSLWTLETGPTYSVSESLKTTNMILDL